LVNGRLFIKDPIEKGQTMEVSRQQMQEIKVFDILLDQDLLRMELGFSLWSYESEREKDSEVYLKTKDMALSELAAEHQQGKVCRAGFHACTFTELVGDNLLQGVALDKRWIRPSDRVFTYEDISDGERALDSSNQRGAALCCRNDYY
jgi:hypothetical protein